MTPYADTATYTVLQNEHIMNSDARICYDNFVLAKEILLSTKN